MRLLAIRQPKNEVGRKHFHECRAADGKSQWNTYGHSSPSVYLSVWWTEAQTCWMHRHRKELSFNWPNVMTYSYFFGTDKTKICQATRLSGPPILSACYSHPIHLIWPLVTSTCFRQSRKNSNGFSSLTRTSFFEYLPAILRGLDRDELNTVFRAWVGRVQDVSEGNGGYGGW
jgi:hypothetical protein